MRLFRRRSDGASTAVAEPYRPAGEEPAGDLSELRAEIARLTEANRARPDRETERRLLWLRHVLALRLLDEPHGAPEHAVPAGGLPDADGGLPEIRRDQLTPGLLRSGILRDGCLLVRGLVDRDAALHFARGIDRAFDERAGGSPAPGFYEEFRPHERFGAVQGREWIAEGGGLLAADAPLLAFEMTELLDAAGVPAVVEGYLGEPALMSVHKTTLRRAEPHVGGAWHQDGTFMGPVRALNLWLSLSRCGDEAPGLDILPRRLDDLLATQTDDAVLEIQISQRVAEEAAGDTPILRPIFEPGDALFFDELFLHQTGSDPAMPKPRFALENWFFGRSAFPADYTPIAVR